MTVICYYSNFCEPSKKLLQVLSHSKLKNEVHFICIDQRTREGNRTILVVQGQRVVLPDAVTRVPALFLVEQNKALFEDEIYRHLSPQEAQINHVATGGLGEPECFSPDQFRSMSDAYSFWDQDAEELGTKGNGGMRQQHNYVSINDSFAINTPADDYEPDKVGKKGSKTLEQYKAERELTVPAPISRT